jgi:prepilin peptidase CpaA
VITGIVYGLILVELMVVAWIDYKTEKISNRWVIVNGVLSIIFHLSFQNLYPLSWEVLLFPAGFIIIGFFLYLFHVMGAGDSKFLASLFLIVPLEFHLLVFAKLILATILTGVVLLSMRILRNWNKVKAYFLSHHWTGIKLLIKSRFTYAPVILLSWILFGFEIWN